MHFPQSLKHALAAAAASLLVAVSFWTVPVQAEAPPAPALWKLTDADSEVWIFGTIHILDPTLSWHSHIVNEAFNKAETLVLEAPALETPPAEIQKLVMKYAMNPAGITLSSLLSEESNQKLIEVLESFGLSEAQAVDTKRQFEPLRPWFVGLQLASMQAQSRGADPKAGVENILTEAAKDANKPISFLETFEQQLLFFVNLSQEKASQMLEDGLVQMLEQPDLLDSLVKDWVAGNADQVGKTLQDAMDDPVIYEALLTNRNQDWARQIKTIMDGSGTYFIAVGTGHLVGKGSLQDFLLLHGLEAARIQ